MKPGTVDWQRIEQTMAARAGARPPPSYAEYRVGLEDRAVRREGYSTPLLGSTLRSVV